MKIKKYAKVYIYENGNKYFVDKHLNKTSKEILGRLFPYKDIQDDFFMSEILGLCENLEKIEMEIWEFDDDHVLLRKYTNSMKIV